MIRINLIATGSDGRNSGGGGLLEFIVLMFLVLIGAGAVYIVYNSWEDRITRASVKLAQERVTVKHLAKAQKTLKRFKSREKELQRQLNIINKLKKLKQGPVRVLDQISVRIPKQVWLTQVNEGRRKQLVLRGVAESNESVAIFLKRLEDSPYFKSVDLQQIVRRRSSKSTKQQVILETLFSVKCKVRFFVQDT